MSDRTAREQQAQILEQAATKHGVTVPSTIWYEALRAGASALRADPSSGRREELEEVAFIINESANIIEASFDGEYVIGTCGLTNALRDLRQLATRLAQLPTEGK